MDFADFPSKTFTVGTTVWRVTRHPNGPWWFSSGLTGRFDLTTPDGTCYVALKATTALLEALRFRHSPIDFSDIKNRRIWKLQLPKDFKLAKLTVSGAFGFGVTKTVSAGDSYSTSQKLAATLFAADFEGVFYIARHPPNEGHFSIALFDKEGERNDWSKTTGEEITGKYLRLLKTYGVEVIDTP